MGKGYVSNVVKSRSFTYDEKVKSEKDINDVEDEENDIDGDCDKRFVDGDVEEMRFETGLALIFVLLLLLLF